MTGVQTCALPICLPALRSAAAPTPNSDVIEFADTDALKALEVITTRRPTQVFVESGFAGTPRGAALVKRIKADPTLAQSAVHVVQTSATAAAGGPVSIPATLDASTDALLAPILDRWGTPA